jgi:hypothetical protein
MSIGYDPTAHFQFDPGLVFNPVPVALVKSTLYPDTRGVFLAYAMGEVGTGAAKFRQHHVSPPETEEYRSMGRIGVHRDGKYERDSKPGAAQPVD